MTWPTQKSSLKFHQTEEEAFLIVWAIGSSQKTLKSLENGKNGMKFLHGTVRIALQLIGGEIVSERMSLVRKGSERMSETGKRHITNFDLKCVYSFSLRLTIANNVNCRSPNPTPRIHPMNRAMKRLRQRSNRKRIDLSHHTHRKTEWYEIVVYLAR